MVAPAAGPGGGGSSGCERGGSGSGGRGGSGSEGSRSPGGGISRIVLEYDGGGFAGWASQPGQRTVQAEVERALAVLQRRPVPVVVAGRTDAGVHALGQVCSYSGGPVDVGSVNALLPPDVTVVSCLPAEEGFDARRDATSRAYCYRVLTRRARPALETGRVLHWPHAVDLELLQECARLLVGVHDFRAFTPTQTEHVRFSREVYFAEWRWCDGEGAEGAVGAVGAVGAGLGCDGDRPGCEGDRLEFWIEADAFMRHMNRVLVGTMLEVAGGRRSVADFVSLLEGRPRRSAGPTAPPQGLYLVGVGYGGRRVLGD